MTGEVSYPAIRWNAETGLVDISELDAPWFDLETNEVVLGWRFESAMDSNEAGQIAGLAKDGVSVRAALFDEFLGFVLLPRAEQSPYREGTHWLRRLTRTVWAKGRFLGRPSCGTPPIQTELISSTIQPVVSRMGHR